MLGCILLLSAVMLSSFLFFSLDLPHPFPFSFSWLPDICRKEGGWVKSWFCFVAFQFSGLHFLPPSKQVRASGPRVVVMFFFLSWSSSYWIYPERWPGVKAAGRRWKRNFGITEKNFGAKFRCGREVLVVRKRGCSQTNPRSCVVAMMLAGKQNFRDCPV